MKRRAANVVAHSLFDPDCVKTQKGRVQMGIVSSEPIKFERSCEH